MNKKEHALQIFINDTNTVYIIFTEIKLLNQEINFYKNGEYTTTIPYKILKHNMKAKIKTSVGNYYITKYKI